MRKRLNGLTARQFYALIWKDFVVHKRHYIWTLLEITIPVLVCAMAILSNSHQGKPRLENERTFDPDDHERLYGDLSPSRHTLLVAPNTTFTRALVAQIDDGALNIQLCGSESELVELIKKEIPVSLDQVKRLLPDDTANVTIGGVVIRTDESIILQQQQQQHKRQNSTTSPRPSAISSDYYEVVSKLEGEKMRIPVNFDMAIRAKDFRLGPEPFPKKYSLGPFLHSDHYASTFFMASQIMLSRAYISLLATYLNDSNSTSGAAANSSSNTIVIPTNDDIIGQRMPYPKYVAHKRLKESTLGTFVAGSQKQKPFVLTMDYCITVGFLVTAIFLAKRIVDEKKSKVRDMLRLVGISDWTYYGSHMSNTMIIMTIQCALITLLFTGHADAPAQNIDSSLLFTILFIYCFASVMFVLALSTLFNSSTKAIIFTSLLWLGLPEIVDRIFKLNSGVIESNGFMAVEENVHLMFSLFPNFGLRLMNRLLTECDIYGEFYDKKQLYGEYRAIWPNVRSVLPLYKSMTLADIMLAMALSVPLYAVIIYLVNWSSSGEGGLAGLGESGGGGADKRSSGGSAGGLLAPIKLIIYLIKSIILAPFKLVCKLLMGSSYKSADSSTALDQVAVAPPPPINQSWSTCNLNQSAPELMFVDPSAKKKKEKELAGSGGGHLNGAFVPSVIELNNYPPPSPTECPNSADSGSEYFERAPSMLRIGVSIRNLCKTYYTTSSRLRQIHAVKNVSLDMFYSQILGECLT